MSGLPSVVKDEDAAGVIIKISKSKREVVDLLWERGFLKTRNRGRLREVRPATMDDFDLTTAIESITHISSRLTELQAQNALSPAPEGFKKATAEKRSWPDFFRRKFSSGYHAFAFFDHNSEGMITAKKAKEALHKLQSDGVQQYPSSEDDWFSKHQDYDWEKGIGFEKFVACFGLGDDVANWSEKVAAARLELQGHSKSLLEQQLPSPHFIPDDTMILDPVSYDALIDPQINAAWISPAQSPAVQSPRSSKDGVAPHQEILSSTTMSLVSFKNLPVEAPSRVAWKENFYKKLALALDTSESRFYIADCHHKGITVILYPDSEDYRNSKLLASDMRALLLDPKNSVCSWDPQIFEGCKISIVSSENRKWDSENTSSFELRPSSCLPELERTRKTRAILSRSDGRFTSLGALAQWKMLDCKVTIGSDTASGDNFLQKFRTSKYLCTILRHENGTTIELIHHSHGNFKFYTSKSSNLKKCSFTGQVSLCHGNGDYFSFDPAIAFSLKNANLECCTLPEPDSEPKTQGPAIARETAVITDNAIHKQFKKIISRHMGRWKMFARIPNIVILNDCEPDMELFLTPQGFTFLGTGPKARALISENGADARSFSVFDARAMLRQVPTMPNDATELDKSCAAPTHEESHAVQSQTQNPYAELQTLRNEAPPSPGEVQTSNETKLQEHYRALLIRNADARHCSCTKALLGLLSIENGLTVHEKVNRRALSIRIVGTNGQACIHGTGCSTELACLGESLRNIAINRDNIIVTCFARRPRHESAEIFSYLAESLKPFLQTDKPIRKIEAGNQYESLGKELLNVILNLVLSDKVVILVLDDLRLVEQRVVAKLMSHLRAELQPWLYNIRLAGYVRVIFSGEDGYSFPSGVPISTVQLNGLQSNEIQAVLRKKLKDYNKYLGDKHIADISKKKEAWKFQYLNVAAEIAKDFWIFEQQMNCCHALPETLVDLYQVLLQKYDDELGSDILREVLLVLHSQKYFPISSLGSHCVNCTEEKALSTFRKLLRSPPECEILELCDADLMQAIDIRYRRNEAPRIKTLGERRQSEMKQRNERMMGADIIVFEQNISLRTACSSLEEAINLAAPGNTITLCKQEYTLRSSFFIDRDLIIKADTHVTGARIIVSRGQPAFCVGASAAMHKFSKSTRPRDIEKNTTLVELSIDGVSLRQMGFEAEEVPRCLDIGENGVVNITRSSVASDSGVGIVVDSGGKLVMKDSICLKCGISCIVVQAGGHATIEDSSIKVNEFTEIPMEKQKLHNLFLKYCGSPTEETSTHISKDADTTGFRPRSELLDLKTFILLMKESGVFPTLMSKTEIAKVFEKYCCSEMSWNQFMSTLNFICSAHNLKEFCGIQVSWTRPRAEGCGVSWKASKIVRRYNAHGIVVNGVKSICSANRVTICGAIHGCLVSNGGSLKLTACKLVNCAKDRLDAAAIMACGKKSNVEAVDCDIEMSENNCVFLKEGSKCSLFSSLLHGAGKQGIMAVGRSSRIEMTSCKIFDISGSGIRAGHEAEVIANDCSILSCKEAAVVSWYLGTKVFLIRCSVQGSMRGICAENEGSVYIDGLDGIEDPLVESRKGNIEKINEPRSAKRPVRSAQNELNSVPASESSEGPCVSGSTESRKSGEVGTLVQATNQRDIAHRTEIGKVKENFAKLFQNVAEASIFMDANGGGFISQVEMERAFDRLGMDVSAEKIYNELGLTTRGILEIPIHDFMKRFKWHGDDKFLEGSWKASLIDARRSRRRIMDKIYERLRMERRKHESYDLCSKYASDFQFLKSRFQHLRAQTPQEQVELENPNHHKSITVIYAKAGHFYASKSSALAGSEPLNRTPSSNGLPGVQKCFGGKHISPRYLQMNTCTLARYPRLHNSTFEDQVCPSPNLPAPIKN